MPDPAVCCVMLTANRPKMARQAVECFRKQTYTPRYMLVWDTGKFTDQSIFSDPVALSPPNDKWGCMIAHGADPAAKSVGELRNDANAQAIAEFRPDIICHFDDDDYSAPQRIAEQVAVLRAFGAEAVGYNSMLFWREDGPVQKTRTEHLGILDLQREGEAWLYTGGIVGTSLMYWRRTWERRHFEPMNNGEDTRFLMGVKAVGVTSIPDLGGPVRFPRMIARIHSGNTSNAYNPEVMRAVEKQGGEWLRVPVWDHCGVVFR